jgi:hypothetical protein
MPRQADLLYDEGLRPSVTPDTALMDSIVERQYRATQGEA